MNDTLEMTPMPWYGYHRRDANDTYALRVADALAAAVRFRIPILDALRCLQTDLRTTSAIGRFWNKHGCDVTSCLSFARWLPGVRWSILLQGLIGDLTDGMPLGLALERRMGTHFPRYYVLALQKAETENQLEAVLPLMAKRMQYQRWVVDDRIPYMPLLVWQLSMILLVFFGHQAFIMPILFEMPLGFGVAPPQLALALMAGLNAVIKLAFGIGLVLFLLMKIGWLREALLPWIPFVAKDKRRLLVRDLAQSMGVFLSTGEDVVTAAGWSLKATTSPWLKRRLGTFVDRITNGENWGLAWEHMQLGAYTYPWLIVNAAARQDPLDGFECLAEWLHQDISHTTRFVRRWLTPCLVIVLGTFVLTIAGTFFLVLSGTWKHCFVP